jgi:hypothetical protein
MRFRQVIIGYYSKMSSDIFFLYSFDNYKYNYKYNYNYKNLK